VADPLQQLIQSFYSGIYKGLSEEMKFLRVDEINVNASF